MRLPQSALVGTAIAVLSALLPGRAEPQDVRTIGAWQSGGDHEPTLRIRRYAPGFWILRQGKHSSPEAPFIYLIAGTSRALLLDTGAEPQDGKPVPLVPVVDSLLATLTSPPDSLLVLHSHGHSDHRFLDSAVAARPRTRVIAATPSAVQSGLGMTAWPDQLGRLELGGRRVLVLPTPGHEPAHLMVYDARTRTLLGGDMLYPGLLTIRDLPAFRASTARLMRFAATHPIRTILGAHVEMSATRGRMYPLGTIAQPDEHPLGLRASAIDSLNAAVLAHGDLVGEVMDDDFALGRVAPPSTDRPSTHGMLLFGTERTYLSHLPMARTPHNYQLVLEAELPDSTLAQYRRDAVGHDTLIYTIEPAAQWVLPNTIRADTTFTAHLYRGHFERGGVRIASDVPVRVRRIVMFRRFEPGDTIAPTRWFGVGSARARFLIHRIAGADDADQVVQLCPMTTMRPDGAPARFALGARPTVGAQTSEGRVCRVLYEERGDFLTR